MRERAIYVILTLLTASVRILYWVHVHDEAWFIAPGMDPEFYGRWANAIIAGSGSDYIPFPRAPLYPYLLALFRTIFGEGWLTAVCLNLLADLITVILVYRLTVKIGGVTFATVAAVLYALCGAAIYYSGETLMTSTAVMLSVAFVYSTSSVWKKPTARNIAMSAVWLALLSLCRPNALLLLPFTGLIFAWLFFRQNDKTAAVRSLVIHWLTAIVIISPVTIANYKASGEFIPISTQGGVNFYIGNAQNATGWASILPDVGGNWTDEDVMRVVGEDMRGNSTASDSQTLTAHRADRHLWKMGWREIASHPLGWSKLMVKKLMLLLDAREIGNNRPLLLASDSSPHVRLLMSLSLGIMLPFALVGVVSHFRLPEVKAALLFIALFGGSLLLFFVNSRYRMPLLPMVAFLAGLGIKHLIETFNLYRKQPAFTLHSAKLPLIFVAGCLLSIPGWVENDWSNRAQAAFVHGNSLMRLNHPHEAVDKYRIAEKLDPLYPELYLNLGVVLLETGDTLEAEEAFQMELENNSNNGKAWNNLGVIAESKRDYERAGECYQASIKVSANPDAQFNLTRVYMKLGDYAYERGNMEAAEDYYRRALSGLGDEARLYHRIAMVRATVNDMEGAAENAQTALEFDPDYDPARRLLGSIH